MVEIARPSAKRIKKFYKTVSVEETADGFAILLDGRAARTPLRAALAAPSRAVGEAIAAEWAGEGEAVDFDTMHLTRLAATAIDLAPTQDAQWAADFRKVAGHDLLCYRAEAPAELVARQEREWTPYLAWAGEALGARLAVATGIRSVEQPQGACAAIEEAARALGPWRLIGAKSALEITGSAVLALALARGAFDPPAIFAASRLDERFQAERWGVDEEAAFREARMEAVFLAAARWLDLLRP